MSVHPCAKKRPRPQGDLTGVGESVLNNCILPMLNLKDLVSLASTNVYFRSFIYFLDCHAWKRPLLVCIDPSCRGCKRVSISEHLAWNLFRNCAIIQLRLHVPVKHLGKCLQCLGEARTVKKLHLRLRVEDDERPLLDTTITSSIESLNPSDFASVNELILYNCKSDKMTDNILRLVGNSVKQLGFLESSSFRLFSMLQRSCPELKYLQVDGPQDAADLAAYANPKLQELRVVGTGFSGVRSSNGMLNFPNIRQLAIIDMDLEAVKQEGVGDVERLVASLPRSVVDLELCVKSRFANHAINVIGGGGFSRLTNVHLHLLDEVDPAPDITFESMHALLRGCPNLMVIQFTDGLVGLAADAFAVFGKFKNLRRLMSLYDEADIACLEAVLKESGSIEEVIFFESADFIMDDGENTRWAEMEEELRCIQEKFPTVHISLRDWWWSNK